MPPQLRRVDPDRSRSWLTRAFLVLGTTRPGNFVSRHVFWRLDPLLLRVTRGRVSSTLVIRTAVLETEGAKSGALRRNAVIYFHDGDRITIAPSNAGRSRNPGWYHNLRVHPDVTFGGLPFRATVVSDRAECERLWTLADRVFPPYEKFRRRAARTHRTIPIVQLTARQADAVA